MKDFIITVLAILFAIGFYALIAIAAMNGLAHH